MTITRKTAAVLAYSITVGLGATSMIPMCYARTAAQTQQTAPVTSSRTLGTVKVIVGNAVTLTTDSGSEVSITVPETARMVRTAPGQKDLTGATPIQMQDVQVGDRILVKTKPSDDGRTLVASSVIVMKKTDIADKQAREREDWQKRGVGGRVSAVDPAAGTITIATNGTNGNRVVTLHVSKSTIVRRYATNSVKFDDATLATIEQIKEHDQVRARGNRNGADLDAEEIVAGTFLNIAGIVLSADVAKNEFTITDLATKKPVLVKITADSQLHKLPPMVAQGIAMRLKGGASPSSAQHGAEADHAPSEASGAGAAGHNGRGDVNQMLGRLPAVTVADLHKGDAVMIVAQGTSVEVTAVTLLSGVEPILTASPKGDGSMVLSPWDLSGGGGGEGSAQ